MISSKIVQLLFLVSSITTQMIGMLPPQEKSRIEKMGEGFAELPSELKLKIIPSALELKFNPKYTMYKKLDIGYRVTGIAFNGDNTRVLTGSADRIARLWDVDKGTVIAEFKGHKDDITSVALSANGNIALTGAWSGPAALWHAPNGQLIAFIEVGSPVKSVALSADGKIALLGSQDGIARLYSTITREIIREFNVPGRTLASVALSADGKIALTSSDYKTVHVWNILTGELTRTIEVESGIASGSPSGSASMALSSDGTTAVVGCEKDNKVLVWDIKTGVLLNRLVTNANSVNLVAVSNNGKRALSSTSAFNNTVHLWDTSPLPGKNETDTPLTEFYYPEKTMTLAFGVDDFIATGTLNAALIWKPAESVTLK